MAQVFSPPQWTHRGCQVQLVGGLHQDDAFLIHHCSGEWMGTAASLEAARQLIDDQIVLVRQRLVASA
jgi:hypothetical protein